jgi:predicted DsbA family dithiol-disulfide isomerase
MTLINVFLAGKRGMIANPHRWIDLLVTVTLVCAIARWATIQRHHHRLTSLGTDDTVGVPTWLAMTEGPNVVGPDDAPVTIVSFHDYGCDACAAVHERLLDLQRRYRPSVRVVMRVVPGRSPSSFEAAAAAHCAAVQGRFESMDSAIQAHKPVLDAVLWGNLARQSRVGDPEAFMHCLSAQATINAVRRDIELAAEGRIVATPTVIVAGRRLRGPTLVQLDGLVRQTIDSIIDLDNFNDGQVRE